MTDNYIAVLQAGGQGTRLCELTGDKIPKPLLKLNGKPMLQWQIEAIARYGICQFIIIIGHLGKLIREYFRDGGSLGVHISYIEEEPENPLGSAGALYYLKDYLADVKGILLAFGDVMFDIDFCRMIAFHEEKDAWATLYVHPNSHPYDSDLVVLDEENRVKRFIPKNGVRSDYFENMVNAGVFLFHSSVLNGICDLKKLDMEKNVLAPLLVSGRIYGYHSTEYVKDAGTVERFFKVQAEQKAGIWEARNVGRRQKCIFLNLELEEYAAEAVRLINESEYLAICVTKQSTVGRGMHTEDEVRRIHKRIATLLGRKGAYLDDIIFCPYPLDKGYTEENPEYKMKRSYKKPTVGMIETMSENYNIDVSLSYLIGGSTADICLGLNAGMKTVLVENGQVGKYKVEADYRAENLYEAVRRILKID